ncbi:hypothetical protein AGMMS49991_00370 [Spirochaetia bacterium]|nr:hypothetical protein AGMMS49991_00370 [Spirochaetia bacterium]
MDSARKSASSGNTARQREFRQRMYDQGYMQKIIWVKREEVKATASGGMDLRLFLARLNELTADYTRTKLSRLYHSILDFVKSQKEDAGKK